VVVRARAKIEEDKRKSRIVVSEIPFQQFRDRVIERIAQLVSEDRIKGISGIRDESDLKEPVRLVIEIKQGHDPEVVLNQLYQFSPLQDTFSMIFLALVDGKPRELNIKELLQEFLRHRVTVIRRRTQFLLNRARRRKHVVEGLLIAMADIDEIIRIIRTSQSQQDAKLRLMGFACPASMLARALGERGYGEFTRERGESDEYKLTSVQADAILKLALGQLANLEQKRFSDEHSQLLDEILSYLEILGDQKKIDDIIRGEVEEIRKKFADARRTEISGEELGNYNLEDLINEETMVVTISHRGYIKRTPAATYRAQRRGGKGIAGAKSEEEDPIEHLFVASTHAYLLFFTSQGKVYWLKVYDLPQMGRDSRGRAVINLLNLAPEEKIMECVPVRDFNVEGHFLLMATRKGIVKKTPLEDYSRPKKGGIIAIKLREDDELVDVVVTKTGEQIVLSTARGMAIRFQESDARPMGRNTSGVKGISLTKEDQVVGMVVADPSATLLTLCENGYGKRTYFGVGEVLAPAADQEEGAESEGTEAPPVEAPVAEAPATESENGDDHSSSNTYRTQRRGGKGVIDIKTTKRNGPVIGIAPVTDEDELLMMTARGKIQRVAAKEISIISRNTQGVRIMSLDEGDTVAAIVRVPVEKDEEESTEKPADKPLS
jgi:DNA gyrase subunit A